jgi:hypothetical protein
MSFARNAVVTALFLPDSLTGNEEAKKREDFSRFDGWMKVKCEKA